MSQVLSIITDIQSWDAILTAVFAILGVVMSVIAWLIKHRLEVYDKHLEECREQEIIMGRMDQRLIAVENEVCGLRKSSHWIGDCVTIIGAKLGVSLPSRPE